MTKTPTLPALDPANVSVKSDSGYPAAFRKDVAGQQWRALGDALGLTQFGVNLVELAPGAWSAQRHWHSGEDEFILVLEGQITLVTDGGEQTLAPGQVAGFAAGAADGHHLVNKSPKGATYLEVGTRATRDEVVYPDIDLLAKKDGGRYVFTDRAGTKLS